MNQSMSLELKENPTLVDLQEYVRKVEQLRGFSNETILQKCLLLGEEVGELFKAVRKSEGVKIDQDSQFGEIPHEVADIFIYLLAVCNKYDIDLEEAFRAKEEKNKKRKWN
jgi:NTP pyrophosphatase (non-canonical NTP hydrolase)